ncbi:MAG TPA: ribonuclease R [Casimicrobiaceae bacterium]|nr:ribonuclease R [Casimicrobiaceae bacterium]
MRRRAATTPRGSAARSADARAPRARGARPNVLSADELLDALIVAGEPLTPAELAAKLGLAGRSKRALDAPLVELERAGRLFVNRKGELCVAAKLDIVTGAVQGHADGFGFLVPDAGGNDLFLPPSEMRKVLHGDRASAKVVGVDRRGRPEGEIVEVVQRANRKIVGRLHEERGVWFVEAENRRISQDLVVPPGERGSATRGQVVVVEIVEQPSAQREAIARVVEVLGDATDPGIEIEIALRKHALPFEWSAAADRLAAKLPASVRPIDLRGRRDLTKLPLVTIDGDNARDFDDAVYCEPAGDAHRLVVAIADVSHYVRDGDALDADARERATSVYFPRRVIPMLPEALSNELCSLKPAVDRLCVACDMRIGRDGTIASYEFYAAVMHSHARLIYSDVHRWLTANAAAAASPNRGRKESPELLPRAVETSLRHLDRVYRALFAARARRGAIDFDTAELEIAFDDAGRIDRIFPSPRNDAHRLIEECMLAANVCAASFLAERGHATLYRVHEGPPADKLAALREFLATSGLALTGGNAPQAGDYAALMARIGERPDRALFETVLLRSLAQARYSPDNVGHFGLAYDRYAHFTSPIRRYPDLLVHRALKAALAGKTYAPKGASLAELGVHCSMTERRADEASRDVLQWLKCHYMRDRVGDVFAGTISGVASFGIFVTLDGLAIDGLVHVTDLPRDYFHFDAGRHALVGERSGRVFQLAGRVRVRVVRVDLEQAKIDFALDDGRR